MASLVSAQVVFDVAVPVVFGWGCHNCHTVFAATLIIAKNSEKLMHISFLTVKEALKLVLLQFLKVDFIFGLAHLRGATLRITALLGQRRPSTDRNSIDH